MANTNLSKLLITLRNTMTAKQQANNNKTEEKKKETLFDIPKKEEKPVDLLNDSMFTGIVDLSSTKNDTPQNENPAPAVQINNTKATTANLTRLLKTLRNNMSAKNTPATNNTAPQQPAEVTPKTNEPQIPETTPKSDVPETAQTQTPDVINDTPPNEVEDNSKTSDKKSVEDIAKLLGENFGEVTDAVYDDNDSIVSFRANGNLYDVSVDENINITKTEFNTHNSKTKSTTNIFNLSGEFQGKEITTFCGLYGILDSYGPQIQTVKYDKDGKIVGRDVHNMSLAMVNTCSVNSIEYFSIYTGKILENYSEDMLSVEKDAQGRITSLTVKEQNSNSTDLNVLNATKFDITYTNDKGGYEITETKTYTHNIPEGKTENDYASELIKSDVATWYSVDTRSDIMGENRSVEKLDGSKDVMVFDISATLQIYAITNYDKNNIKTQFTGYYGGPSALVLCKEQYDEQGHITKFQEFRTDEANSMRAEMEFNNFREIGPHETVFSDATCKMLDLNGNVVYTINFEGNNAKQNNRLSRLYVGSHYDFESDYYMWVRGSDQYIEGTDDKGYNNHVFEYDPESYTTIYFDKDKNEGMKLLIKDLTDITFKENGNVEVTFKDGTIKKYDKDGNEITDTPVIPIIKPGEIGSLEYLMNLDVFKNEGIDKAEITDIIYDDSGRVKSFNINGWWYEKCEIEYDNVNLNSLVNGHLDVKDDAEIAISLGYEKYIYNKEGKEIASISRTYNKKGNIEREEFREEPYVYKNHNSYTAEYYENGILKEEYIDYEVWQDNQNHVDFVLSYDETGKICSFDSDCWFYDAEFSFSIPVGDKFLVISKPERYEGTLDGCKFWLDDTGILNVDVYIGTNYQLVDTIPSDSVVKFKLPKFEGYLIEDRKYDKDGNEITE